MGRVGPGQLLSVYRRSSIGTSNHIHLFGKDNGAAVICAGARRNLQRGDFGGKNELPGMQNTVEWNDNPDSASAYRDPTR
jgi:hypothetical protein